MLVLLCVQNPGIRVLLGRKTLKSMRQSILVTMEEWAFPRGFQLQSKDKSGASPKGRRYHQEPRYSFLNGSEIVCYGFDDPEKIKSSEYDIIAVNEGTEITLNDWEIATSRLRHNKLPYGHLALIDCNPGAPQHWLNRRANDGKMHRIKTYHEDNPTLFDPETGLPTNHGKKYIERLDELTGVRYQRLRLGNWVAAEGAIWPNFNEHDHMLDGELKQDETTKRWRIIRNDGDDIGLLWFFAGVDWGWKNPGSILVFGVDKDNKAYMVHEVYRCEKDKVWWAEKAETLREKYDIARFICDSAEPDSIHLFNKRMCEAEGAKIAYPVDKHRIGYEPSFSVVREMFDKKRLFLLRDALEAEDKMRRDARKPTCWYDEIPNYCYKPEKDGQAVREEPAADSEAHGCDGARYSLWWFDHNDWRPEEEVKGFPKWSYGDVLGHDEVEFTGKWG